MGKNDIPSSSPSKKPALVQFGNDLWNKLTGQYESPKPPKVERMVATERKNIIRQSSTERRNFFSAQSVNTYTAGERLSPQETVQKIRSIFGDVKSVKIPRENGVSQVATRRSDGLFYFAGKNTPCYLGKNETVSKNIEQKEALLTYTQKVQVETRGKINKLLPWNWSNGDIGNALINSVGESYYINQDKKNNCGPTACAIAAARLLKGISPSQLRDRFTKLAPGLMQWDTPKRLLGSLGLMVEQRSSLSSSDINALLNQGNVILASTTRKSGLTKGGHITALTGTRGVNQWVNSDPNIKNIRKGLGTVGPQNLMNGGAQQYWIVSKGSNAIA